MGQKGRTIMAIGAHVGDMELTCGGILAKHAIKGDGIITVALTAGEKGNPPSVSVEDYKKQKIGEAENFAEMLGGKAIVITYGDGELPVNDEVKFAVADIIREFKPDILITHWKNSIHKDHANTYLNVCDARYYAGNPGFIRKLPAHSVPSLYFAENWEDPMDFKPYVYVDFTEGYELWKKAVSKHWFVTGSKDFRYLEYYDALSIVRGCECGKQRAQAFMVRDLQMKNVVESL